MKIETRDRTGRSQGHVQNELCDPAVILKGDSYRLKDRDLGRVVPNDDAA